MNLCQARISPGGDTRLPRAWEGLWSGVPVEGGYMENFRILEIWDNWLDLGKQLLKMNSNYITNIIPRLKKFAQYVEIKEALVDKVWVIYGDTDLIEYEFERTGEIAVTKNGNSYDGSWKILGSGRLKIKTDFTNNTLEYNFSVPGILVMKIGGLNNTPFLLYDPKVVKNGNIGIYLENLEQKRKQISSPQIRGSNQPYQGFEILWMFIIGIIIFVVLLNKCS
jgi:hypothetical protein